MSTETDVKIGKFDILATTAALLQEANARFYRSFGHLFDQEKHQ